MPNPLTLLGRKQNRTSLSRSPVRAKTPKGSLRSISPIAYTLAVLWELVFMLVILKIPVVYLCAVVWWAIRAEPLPPEGAGRLATLEPSPCDWKTGRRRPVRPLPRGGRHVRARRTVQAAR